MNRQELIDEIKQVAAQYNAEVDKGRKAWPRSIKERVASLLNTGMIASAVSCETEIPCHTILKWRKLTADVVDDDHFREVVLRRTRKSVQKVAMVTEPTNTYLPLIENKKVSTVTVTTPEGYVVALNDVCAVAELISLLRRTKR